MEKNAKMRKFEKFNFRKKVEKITAAQIPTIVDTIP